MVIPPAPNPHGPASDPSGTAGSSSPSSSPAALVSQFPSPSGPPDGEAGSSPPEPSSPGGGDPTAADTVSDSIPRNSDSELPPSSPITGSVTVVAGTKSAVVPPATAKTTFTVEGSVVTLTPGANTIITLNPEVISDATSESWTAPSSTEPDGQRAGQSATKIDGPPALKPTAGPTGGSTDHPGGNPTGEPTGTPAEEPASQSAAEPSGTTGQDNPQEPIHEPSQESSQAADKSVTEEPTREPSSDISSELTEEAPQSENDPLPTQTESNDDSTSTITKWPESITISPVPTQVDQPGTEDGNEENGDEEEDDDDDDDDNGLVAAIIPCKLWFFNVSATCIPLFSTQAINTVTRFAPTSITSTSEAGSFPYPLVFTLRKLCFSPSFYIYTTQPL